MKKPQLTKREKLQQQLKDSLGEKMELNCHVFGKIRFTIGDFLATGIVSKKIYKQAPAWHDDMLAYPTTKALMTLVKESK
jgi:hypothetical protein|tara:strand:+ start:221 stop:460 length:240 start_codon:yes stop_codon:yes gene_type:complete